MVYSSSTSWQLLQASKSTCSSALLFTLQNPILITIYLNYTCMFDSPLSIQRRVEDTYVNRNLKGIDEI